MNSAQASAWFPIGLQEQNWKLLSDFKSLYSRWECLFPAGCVSCGLTGSLLPKHLPKKCNASRCFSASRCTACSSYCCFYQVEHCISGCRVISSQTYSYHSWHVGIGGFKKHKPRALVSGKQWVKSWPSTDTKLFASNSSFWNKDNGGNFPESLHVQWGM